jgi:hypothetical protein
MPEVILPCPQCERTLRVAESLLGQLVKCPNCGLTLIVPVPGVTAAHPPLAPPTSAVAGLHPPDRADQAAAYVEETQRQAQPLYLERQQAVEDRAWSLVMPPAICLLITGVFGLLADLAQVTYALLSKPGAALANADPNDPWAQFQERLQQGATGPAAVVMGAVFAAVSFLVILAAIQMMRLRMHGFATAGTDLAMMNLVNCCCLFGLPVGIWTLVVLSRPEVRSAFH